MKEKSLIGIKFIGWFQILGALIVLLTLNVKQTPAFNVRFAVPFLPEVLVKIFVIILSLIIGYGYLKRTKWGYFSMLIYSILFCCISIFQMNQYNAQPFIGNFIYSAFVVIYTILHFKYFNKSLGLV